MKACVIQSDVIYVFATTVVFMFVYGISNVLGQEFDKNGILTIPNMPNDINVTEMPSTPIGCLEFSEGYTTGTIVTIYKKDGTYYEGQQCPEWRTLTDFFTSKGYVVQKETLDKIFMQKP
jgi:hypothetical protein